MFVCARTAEIATFENAERIADQEEQDVEREQTRNAERTADLEKQNADLDRKNDNLNDKVLQLEL